MTQAAKTVIVDSAETAIEIFEKVGCPSVAEFIRWLQKEEQKDLVHVGMSLGTFEQFNLGEIPLVTGYTFITTPLEHMLVLAQGVALNMEKSHTILEEIFAEMVEINRLIEKGEFLDQGDVF